MSEGHFQCVHTIRFSGPTKIGSLKTDRVYGPLQVFRIFLALFHLFGVPSVIQFYDIVTDKDVVSSSLQPADVNNSIFWTFIP